MKKLLFLGIVALTGCLWADRTANQGWVAKNFAPSNLVTRVKALEDAPVAELDPVFEVWRNSETVAIGSASTADNSSVAVGMTSFSVGNGCVVVGKGSQALANGAIALGSDNFATGMGSIAIGSGATATAIGAVQIGGGGNSTANTLQFRGYQLVGADGKIPSARLPAITEQDPAFYAWRDSKNVEAGYYAVAGNGAIAIGNQASAQATEAIGIGDSSVATGGGSIAIGWGAMTGADGAIQLGLGSNTASDTLQVRDYMLLDANGKIPAGRLSDSLSNYIPRNGTAGVFLADKSKWYVGDEESMLLAIGYKSSQEAVEGWVYSPRSWNFKSNSLRICGDGIDTDGSVLLKKAKQMTNFLNDAAYETLDQRIARLADTSSCVKTVAVPEYEDEYCFDKAIAIANAGKTDVDVSISKNRIRNRYINVNDEGAYFGENRNMVLSPEGPSISVNGGSHWMNFQNGKSGTIALTGDINAANVLAAIKAMTDAQKAELKTALGL